MNPSTMYPDGQETRLRHVRTAGVGNPSLDEFLRTLDAYRDMGNPARELLEVLYWKQSIELHTIDKSVLHDTMMQIATNEKHNLEIGAVLNGYYGCILMTYDRPSNTWEISTHT